MLVAKIDRKEVMAPLYRLVTWLGLISLAARPPIKLIAVSGYGHAQAVERSINCGFDLHLVKPVNPKQLASLLQAI